MATTTKLRQPCMDHDSDRMGDTRLVELVMALTDCTARRAVELVRHDMGDPPLERVAFALAMLRAEDQFTARTASTAGSQPRH